MRNTSCPSGRRQASVPSWIRFCCCCYPAPLAPLLLQSSYRPYPLQAPLFYYARPLSLTRFIVSLRRVAHSTLRTDDLDVAEVDGLKSAHCATVDADDDGFEADLVDNAGGRCRGLLISFIHNVLRRMEHNCVLTVLLSWVIRN